MPFENDLASVDDLIMWSASSSFSNFLSDLYGEQRSLIRDRLASTSRRTGRATTAPGTVVAWVSQAVAGARERIFMSRTNEPMRVAPDATGVSRRALNVVLGHATMAVRPRG